MEFILTNKQRKDMALDVPYIDIEVGPTTSNTFEYKVNEYDSTVNDLVCYVYALGTEYGGIVYKVTDNSGDITCSGDTFRGMLARKCVPPSAGRDYVTLNGDINRCIERLFGTKFDDLFTFGTDAGITVSNYDVARYTTLLDALETLCDDFDCRLNLSAYTSSGKLYVKAEAVPVTDYSSSVEFSEDMNIDFEISRAKVNYTHMVCLGSGELQNRLVKTLYWNDKKPVDIDTYTGTAPTGINRRDYIYENTGCSTAKDLIKDGKKKFLEINKKDEQEIELNESDDLYNLGDIVAGKSFVTGITVKKPITGKVITFDDGELNITYKVGD